MSAHEKSIRCGHCNNVSVMKLIEEVEYLPQRIEGEPEQSIADIYVGNHYALLECPACCGITIALYPWNDSYDGDDDPDFWINLRCSQFLYPPNSQYANDANRREVTP